LERSIIFENALGAPLQVLAEARCEQTRLFCSLGVSTSAKGFCVPSLDWADSNEEKEAIGSTERSTPVWLLLLQRDGETCGDGHAPLSMESSAVIEADATLSKADTNEGRPE
jgi:hypothetical protein